MPRKFIQPDPGAWGPEKCQAVADECARQWRPPTPPGCVVVPFGVGRLTIHRSHLVAGQSCPGQANAPAVVSEGVLTDLSGRPEDERQRTA